MIGAPGASALRGAERSGDQLRHAGEKFGAHGGVKAVAVGAAEREQAHRALVPERHQRHRGHFQPLGPEQELALRVARLAAARLADRKSTRLNSSHEWISYAVFCLKKKKTKDRYRSKYALARRMVPR